MRRGLTQLRNVLQRGQPDLSVARTPSAHRTHSTGRAHPADRTQPTMDSSPQSHLPAASASAPAETASASSGGGATPAVNRGPDSATDAENVVAASTTTIQPTSRVPLAPEMLEGVALRVLAPAELDTLEVRSSNAFEGHADDLATFSPTGPCVKDLAEAIEVVDSIVQADPRAARAVGAMVGMAVADSVGHFFEFLPVVDKPFASGSGFELKTLSYTNVCNRFGLKQGQWTDDTAMGLCLADSLLASFRADPTATGNPFDGSDVRARFHSWWYHGYNNAFAADEEREPKVSVGLGGNISLSLRVLEDGVPPPPVFERDADDAGNGSLMRLAPVPILFWANHGRGREVAAAQSYTTHPGPMAACCCEFLTFATARAIVNPEGTVGGPDGAFVASWLDDTVKAFLSELDAEGKTGPGWDELRRLLASAEPDDSPERCWNWRADSLQIVSTLARRGRSYNGHPVMPPYYGAFSMDGLALALFCVRQTRSFGAAIERCVNFLGDADSTGSMVGQLAGAIYGMEAIDRRLVDRMLRWDPKGTIPLRAALLFAAGRAHADGSVPLDPEVQGLPGQKCGWEVPVVEPAAPKKSRSFWPWS